MLMTRPSLAAAMQMCGAFGLGLLMVGCAGLGAPAQAQAIGFASWQPDYPPKEAFNSSGGAITASDFPQNGLVKFTFAGLGDGLHSNVQINGPGGCSAVKWSSPNKLDVVVEVQCQSYPPGGPDVFYQSRSSWSGAGGLAFLWADQPSAANYTPNTSYQFNSTGSVNTITRTAQGRYSAHLPGLDAKGGTALVTAYGSQPAKCEIAGWREQTSLSAGPKKVAPPPPVVVVGLPSFTTAVDVACFDASGQPADERFSLAYSIGATIGVGPSTPTGAYAWVDNAQTDGQPHISNPAYQFNSMGNGLLTVQRVYPGRYVVSVPVAGIDFSQSRFSILVSAYGTPAVYCRNMNTQKFPTEVSLMVWCYDNTDNNNTTDSKYTLTVILKK